MVNLSLIHTCTYFQRSPYNAFFANLQPIIYGTSSWPDLKGLIRNELISRIRTKSFRIQNSAKGHFSRSVTCECVSSDLYL